MKTLLDWGWEDETYLLDGVRYALAGDIFPWVRVAQMIFCWGWVGLILILILKKNSGALTGSQVIEGIAGKKGVTLCCCF